MTNLRTFSQWHTTNKKSKQDEEFKKLFPLLLEKYILDNLYEDLEPSLVKALRDIYLSILRKKVASDPSKEIEPIEIYEGFMKALSSD